MKKLICLFFVAVTLFSCRPSSALLELRRVETIIQDEPKTALSDLYQINRNDLRSPKERALYALLLSMALDKNYVDLKSDTLIAPAVKYYAHSTDRYHKFLSLYCNARIYENAGNFDKALKAYKAAEESLCDGVPKDYHVRTYVGKQRVYGLQYAQDRALEEAQKAAQHSKELANPLFYLVNCLDIATFYYRLEEPDKARQTLDTLKAWMERRQIAFPSSYYRSRLRQMMYHEQATNDSLLLFYHKYQDACRAEKISSETILSVDVLNRLGQYEAARDVLGRLKLSGNSSIYDSIRFYSSSAECYKGLKRYDDYIANHSEYDRLAETMMINVFNSDVRFLEERYDNAREREKERQRLVISIVLSVIFLLLLIAGSVYYVRKKKEYEESLNEVKEEYSFYRELFGNGNVSDDVKKLLGDQLSALSPYFIKVPTPRISRREINIIRINNQEFLRNVGLLYAISYPAFVSELVRYKLNPEEIGLCSLYASGYVSKEIKDFVSGGSIYRINVSIRNKLGEAVGKKTLPAWLRNLFGSTTEEE